MSVKLSILSLVAFPTDLGGDQFSTVLTIDPSSGFNVSQVEVNDWIFSNHGIYRTILRHCKIKLVMNTNTKKTIR